MKKVLIPLVLVILSLLGIVDAGYITYNKLSGIVPPCTPGFQCEKVLNSRWASVGPIPLSVFGLVFYATFFALSVRAYFGHTEMRNALMGLGTFGFLFSLYLFLMMNFILRAFCLYCLLSAFTCMSLFLVVSYYWQSTKVHHEM